MSWLVRVTHHFSLAILPSSLCIINATCQIFVMAVSSAQSDGAQRFLSNTFFKHIGRLKSLVHLLFINFLTAFNCFQSHILADGQHGIDVGLICWLLDFLAMMLQRVRLNGVLLDILLSSTGSPQGCVLFPLLFASYTNLTIWRQESPHNYICWFHNCLTPPVQ